jgi:hypothetical protein
LARSGSSGDNDNGLRRALQHEPDVNILPAAGQST